MPSRQSADLNAYHGSSGGHLNRMPPLLSACNAWLPVSNACPSISGSVVVPASGHLGYAARICDRAVLLDVDTAEIPPLIRVPQPLVIAIPRVGAQEV